MDIIQFNSLYIPVSLYRGFFGFFLHHVEHKIFPYKLLHCLVPGELQHKADFYKHNFMKDKGALLSHESVILSFTIFSSLKEILIMKRNCEKQVLINQVFFPIKC